MKNNIFPRLALAFALTAANATSVHAGSIARLIYDGVTGSTVASLTNASIWPDGPTFREQLDDFVLDPFGNPVFGFQGKDNSFIDFGSWTRGYLEAPTNGDFVFFIASDDSSELWLSTNHLASNAVRIAYESGSGAPLFSGARLSERQSVPIVLARGEKYYVEVRHKQDQGASYIQVGWQRPDGVQEIIPALHLAQHPLDAYLGRTDANAAPFFNDTGLNGGNLLATASVTEFGSLLLQVDVIAAQPTTFQWLSNGVPISGENLSFLRWPAVPASANGATIQVVVSNQFGTLSSATTTLTVTPDSTPLGVLLVDHRGNPNGVRVTFSKPVNPATATNLANYALSAYGGGSLTINSARLLGDPASVQLAGAFNFQVSNQYQLTIQNVEDTVIVPNGLSPNPTNIVFAFVGEHLGPVGFATNSPLGNLGVLENRPAHFEVIPTGASPFTYQWLLNSLPIPDATNRALDFTALLANAGDYRVVISNEFSSATSIVAHLTVIADTAPPQLLSIRGLAGGLNEVRLSFDELLDPVSATNPTTYALGLLPVTSATLNRDGRSVVLHIGANLIHNQLHLLTINGLKDTATASNALSTTAAFVAQVSYVGTVLADNPVRLWRFDETNGSSTLATLTAVKDTLANSVASLVGTPLLEISSLLSNETDNTALQFSATNLQRLIIPNGSDLNKTSGPWAKKSFEFWFRANSVPAPGTTGLGATAGIWEEGGVNRGLAVYLWRDPTNSDPNQASLVFHAWNNASDGAGAPWGATANLTVPAIFAQTPIQAAQTYHVVAVLDGDASGTTGNLILYLNGVEVSRVGGVGQLYNHTGDIRVGHGNGLIHTGQSGDLGYFDGVLDDLSLYNRALTPGHIAAHYRAGAIDPEAGAVAPSVTRVDTRGNPNQLLVTFNKPVSAATANDVANYALQLSGGAQIPILNALRLAGERTVWLTGNFGLQAGASYILTVSNITDLALPPNGPVANPTNVLFTFGAPSGDFYSFDSGLPDDVQVYGNSGVIGSGSYNGSGYLRLTDAATSKNGLTVFTGRHDVDQLHLHFKARLSDTSLVPADGFSVTLASDLPTATFGNGEEGYLPLASLNTDRLIVAFDNYASSVTDYSPSIAVKWRGVEITNVLTGTNGIPALSNTNGTWVDVDILLQRSGKITVVYDGVTVINQVQTGFDLLANAQLGLAARTGSSYETHWFDDLSVNYSENDLGPVAISADSELGNVVAYENQLVHFAVVPTGVGPFRYQWYYEGSPIPGGNTRVLNLVATTNITGHYYAVAQNEFSQATTAHASLAVDTDYIPPSVQSIVGLGSLNEIRVWFTEPVDGGTATNLANYSAGALALLSATLSADGREVILKTGPQVFQQGYTLQITGVKDRSATGNILNGQARFFSTVSYPDEVLADSPIRYYRLDETNGTTVNSLVSVLDVLPTTYGTLTSASSLNQASLLPNTAGNGAIRLTSGSSQRVVIQNGADINTAGPWDKRTVEFWFNALSVPAPGTTKTAASTGLFEEGAASRGLHVYLWRNPTNSNAGQADLVLNAWNNTSDGPGSPYGVPGTPIYVSTPVTTGVTYHVVAVFDGGTNLATGQIILYLNGVEAARRTGVGLLYGHTSDIQIGRGSTVLHTTTNTTAITPNYFNGYIDEVSLYNTALNASRVATHYQIGLTALTAPAFNPITVQGGNIAISWTGGARLLWSTNANGPFSDVPGAVSPYLLPLNTEPKAFFRLAR